MFGIGSWEAFLVVDWEFGLGIRGLDNLRRGELVTLYSVLVVSSHQYGLPAAC